MNKNRDFRLGLTAVLMALSAVAAFPLAAWAMTVKELGRPTGYVNDYTRTLKADEKQTLESITTELVNANTTELAIVIIDTTGGKAIEDYAQELFQTWGIGKKGADNGVLILVAMRDREWRVHTGYGVEGVLTDTLARRIMENEAVPEFKADRYGQGLINASREMSAVLQGEKYRGAGSLNLGRVIAVPIIGFIIGLLIWLAVRVKCPRCGSRVKLLRDDQVLEATYTHAGIRKRSYECTVCHHQFSRMTTIPVLVEKAAAGAAGGSSGWSGGGGGSGGGSFGGFGGGSSGGGGASGGW